MDMMGTIIFDAQRHGSETYKLTLPLTWLLAMAHGAAESGGLDKTYLGFFTNHSRQLDKKRTSDDQANSTLNPNL